MPAEVTREMLARVMKATQDTSFFFIKNILAFILYRAVKYHASRLTLKGALIDEHEKGEIN
jgi:hypothetical protein